MSPLKLIADNADLFNALKECLLAEFSVELINTEQTNEQMGEIARAVLMGKKNLQRAFTEIEKHKTVPDSPAKSNPAR